MSASALSRVRTIAGAALLLSATAIAAGQVQCDDSYCIAPENGAGTADLPGACPLRAPDGSPIDLVNGLPPDTALRCDWSVDSFFDITYAVGGSLGGEVVTYHAILHLDMHGTGQLAGFERTLQVPLLMEMHTAPRTPGEPVQSFDTQMFMLQGAISGDPDFDLLSVVAGGNFGMPSPGHTTLTRIPSGDWAVDSFFDITYRISFQGAPGSVLDGVSSSTDGKGPARNSSAPNGDCVIPPGTGGVPDLPAPCPWHSPAGLDIIEGLPAGMPAHAGCTVDSFFDITYQVGGQLGGGLVGGSAICHLHIDLGGGFVRDIDLPVTFLFDRSRSDDPTASVVPIEMEMLQLHGQIFGDPDFDLLRVTAGSDFGLPSPGHTTLTRLPSSGDWAVDSFFDITYRIDFQGAPGSVLDGLGGATVSTSRLEQGLHNPPAPVHAFGLPNLPLGDACIDGGGGGGAGGSLVLENIGSSGEDGVSVDLGHADGFVVQLDQLGAGSPPGASICARAVRRDADGDGQGIYEVCFENDGDGLVAFDLSVFGFEPREIRAAARLGGTTVDDVVLTPPYPDALLTYGGGGGGGRIAVRSSCCDDDCDDLDDALRFILRSGVPGEVQLSGGSLVLADSVLLCIDSDSDDDGVSDITSLSGFDVRAAGAEQVSITGEALSLFGNPHAALGNARIHGAGGGGGGAGGTLRVGNIGSSGQDGVSVDLRDAPSFGGTGGGGGRIALGLASAPPDLPGTTLLRCTPVGMIDGAPGTISTVQLDGAGGAQSVIIGPTPWMAPESIRAELRLDGVLVLAADGLASGHVATSFVPQVPGTYVFELASAAGGGGTGVSHTFVWNSSADMSLAGQPPVSADELRVIATQAQAPLKGTTGATVELQGLRLHAAGMNELSITDEQTGPPPAPPCPADINASGAIDVDDLIAIIVAWGSADPAADVNDDGVVNVDDLIDVILAWGPCGAAAEASAGKRRVGRSGKVESRK